MKLRLLLCVLIAPLCASIVDNAEDYSANSNLQLDWAMELFEKGNWRGDERVLDIGSGDGKITAIMASRLPIGFATGLDLSYSMNAFASRNFAGHNLLYLQGDLCSFPFCEQFDAVTAFMTLIWIPDQQRALHAIHDSLVPGGLFFACMPGANPRNLSTVAERLVTSPYWAPYFPHFQPQRFYLTADECAFLLQNAGLEPLLLEETETHDFYPSLEALIAWLRPLTEFANHLPPPDHEQFLLELATNMSLQTLDGIWLPSTKLELIACRPLG